MKFIYICIQGMIGEKVETIKKNVTFLGCLIFLFIFYIRNIDSLMMPAICMDEIGYWANAAFWNDWNWSSVIGNFAPYYSYGYSIILFFLMKFFKDPFLLHQAAIIVNIAMIICGYCIMTHLMKKFFDRVNEALRNIICLVPFFYPSIQHHTQIAWTETYLFFLFLVSVVLLIKVFETGKTIYYFFFALVLMDMYITHQRSIAIVILGGGLLLVMTLIKKNRWKQLGIFVVIIILCIVGSSMMKKLIREYVYTDNIVIDNGQDERQYLKNINDFQGQIGKFQYIFSIDGFGNLFISFMGKIYYFIIASFMTGGMGLWYLVYEMLKYFKNKDYNNLEAFLYCYILGAYLGTTLVAAIFAVYPSRLDTVAYGRYTDWIGIIIITLGIFNLLLANVREKVKIMLSQIIFCLLFLLIFLHYIEKYNVSDFFPTCSQIFRYFSYYAREAKTMLIYMAKAMILGGVIIGIITLVEKISLKTLFITFFLIYYWIVITEPAIDDIILLQHESDVCPIVEYIQQEPEKQIYYLYDDTSCNMSNLWTGSIQYLLQDRSIYCIKDISKVKEDVSIVIVCESISVPQGYTVECETALYKVIRKDS